MTKGPDQRASLEDETSLRLRALSTVSGLHLLARGFHSVVSIGACHAWSRCKLSSVEVPKVRGCCSVHAESCL